MTLLNPILKKTKLFLKRLLATFVVANVPVTAMVWYLFASAQKVSRVMPILVHCHH
jgi:hypothetical protein